MPHFSWAKRTCWSGHFWRSFQSTYHTFAMGLQLIPLSRHHPRALVVDDDPAVRILLRRFLSDIGLHVIEADNPFAALGRMAEGPYDLAITDVNMPQRSGVWLLEELRG